MNIKLDDLGVLFENSWKRLRARFAVGIEIFIAPVVLILIGRLLLVERMPAALVLGVVIELIGGIVSVFASIALISTFGNKTDFAGSYTTSFKLFWAWIWVVILATLAMIGGFVILIIPGIMLVLQLALVNYMVVLEGKRGLAALNQSREYIKGYWWAFLGRYILLMLFLGLAMLILYLPATLLGGYAFGQLVYAILILIFGPLSIAYQYEIYSNLRRLKPELSENTAAAKTDSGFLKVSIVLGIVGIAAFFILAVVGAIFLPTYFSKWNNQYPNGYHYNGGYGYGYPPTPTMTGTSTVSGNGNGTGGNENNGMQITPTSGPVGTMVTISGGDFAPTNTILMRGLVAARDIAPAADGTLTFTVPQSLAPNCNSDQACPQFLLVITSGEYEISVMNAGGSSTAGTFTVTGAPLNPGTPSADGSD